MPNLTPGRAPWFTLPLWLMLAATLPSGCASDASAPPSPPGPSGADMGAADGGGPIQPATLGEGSCHHEGSLDGYQLEALAPAAGPDYAVKLQLTIDQVTSKIDPVYQSSSFANYNNNENIGGYEAGVALRRKDGRSYRLLLSSAWGEAVLWSSCGGILQVRPVQIAEGQTYAVDARVVGSHLMLSVDGKPVIDYWDTRAPLGAGDPALVRGSGQTRLVGVQIVPLGAGDDRATPPVGHKPSFSVRPWKDLQWGFDGDEPIFAFGPDPVAYEIKLMPGYHPQSYIPWYAQNYTGTAFLPNQLERFAATEQGDRLVMQVDTVDPVNGVKSQSAITVTYDVGTTAYVYSHVTNIVIPKGQSVVVNDPIDFADPNMLNAVGPASPTLDPQWPQTLRFSAYQHKSGAVYKQPHNHQAWYPGYATPIWNDNESSVLKPDGGFWVEAGDPVSNPLFVLQETPNRVGEFNALMCNWAYDLHMQWSPPGGLGTAISAGTYSMRWKLTAVGPDEANRRLMAAQFALPGDLQKTWLLYTGGVGHVETFDKVVLRASPHQEYAWGDGALQDPTVGRTDRSSLLMNGPTVAGNLLGGSQFMESLVPDSDYEVSVWVKTRGVRGEGPGFVMADQEYYPGVTGTQDWRRIGFVWHTSASEGDLAQVPFLLHHSGSGQVWFDDFQLRQVTPQAPIGAGLSNAPRPLVLAGGGGPDLRLSYDATSDAGDATVLDLSGHGNHARRYNAAWVDDGGRRVLSFDGKTSYVEMVGHPGVDLSQPATVSLWVKPTAAPAEGEQPQILNGGDPLFTWWFLQARTVQGVTRAEFVLNGKKIFSDSAPLPMRQWTHLLLSHDGTTGRLYQNGVLVAQVDAPGDWIARGAYLRLGAAMVWEPTWFFQGRIGRTRVYGRLLTAAEIAAEAKSLP